MQARQPAKKVTVKGKTAPRTQTKPPVVKNAIQNHSIRANTVNTKGPKLPRATMRRPLHINAEDKIHDNLKQKSKWYSSIIDPARGGGVKIPDDVAVQTGTLQLNLETAMTVNPQGLTGFRTATLYPNSAPGGDSNGSNYDFLTTGSGIETITWTNSNAGFPTTAALKAYSHAVRIVSAGLYVQSEVSLSNATGEMMMGAYMMGMESSPEIDEYRNNYGAAIMPLNMTEPMVAIWTPISRGTQTYNSFYDPNLTTIGPTGIPHWMLYCIVQGAVPGSVFRVRLIVNYEFVPFQNAIDIISANPSPIDQTEVDLVESWVSETPMTRQISDKEISESPGAQVLDEKGPQDGGETGFGMFFDVITELLPLALSVI